MDAQKNRLNKTILVISINILTLNFCPENAVCLFYAAYIQVHLGLDFIMEANTTNPDQSDLGPYFCNIGYLRT